MSTPLTSPRLSRYDFSYWTLTHPGGPSPIEAWALAGSASLGFPDWHASSYWDKGKRGTGRSGDELQWLGRRGDVVDFADLPAAVQNPRFGTHVGASSGHVSEGFEACGSPDEVANDALEGSRYHLTTHGDSGKEDQYGLDQRAAGITSPRTQVFVNTVLEADDQLRQRVAWALQQIFVLAGIPHERTEMYATWHDIFVRNAFGTFGQVLKEVSYSPAMGAGLTL